LSIIENLIGEFCKKLIPIRQKIFFGNQQSSISVCTLSSIDLLQEISNSSIMKKIAIVGRLLSENKGIDSLVKKIIQNNIKTIIICGKEVSGHKAGHSLLFLYKNGIDLNGRIIGSSSPNPQLTVTKNEVEKFRNQVSIINKIGETDVLKIYEIINSLKY